jgi:hypothetical protein
MNAPHPTATGPRFFVVVTSSGLRMTAWATSADDACSKVHGAIDAWEGFEPLPPARPANDNGRRVRP